jgi:DNA repair protein RAD50
MTTIERMSIQGGATSLRMCWSAVPRGEGGKTLRCSLCAVSSPPLLSCGSHCFSFQPSLGLALVFALGVFSLVCLVFWVCCARARARVCVCVVWCLGVGAGIRSFSPQKEPQDVYFYKPLTLIVGQNGAGKTTVIECLKYATTGEYPPGASNGQAFVHDTRVAGESHVKALIRLRFRDVNGVSFVCTRQLQLIQKAKTQQCRTMGGSLIIKNPHTGTKVSKAAHCSALDVELPELMGVTKPILQHVIFCHQEESNWPLGDSASLKKRFDAIFAATRYTKAVDSLRKQKKAQDIQNKQNSLQLEHLATKREHSLRISNEVEQLRQQNQKLLSKQREFEEHIATLDGERTRARQIIQQSRAGVTKLQSQQSVLETMHEELRRLEASIKQIYTGVDACGLLCAVCGV